MRIRRRRTSTHERIQAPVSPQDQVRVWVLRALAEPGVLRACMAAYDAEIVLDYVGVALDRRLGPARQLTAATSGVQRALADVAGLESQRGHDVLRNAERLSALVHLPPAARELLALAVTAEHHVALEVCLRHLAMASDCHVDRFFGSLGRVIGHDATEVAAALAADSTLARAGLLQFRTRQLRDGAEVLEPSQEVVALLTDHFATDEALVARLVAVTPAPELSLVDFEHLEADVALLCDYLCAALAKNLRGVNVLLYGPAGTGKTQLSRAVAHELGATLYEVGVASDRGHILKRHDRFQAFQLCQAILQDRPGALLAFDESEDAFAQSPLMLIGEDGGRDKGWINHTLEENRVPTLWLTNHVDGIDPAYLRRFDLVVEVPVPPRHVRRAMLVRHLDGLAVSDVWLTRYAADAEVTPADIARAGKVVRTIAAGNAESVLERALGNHLLALRGPKPPEYRSGPLGYDLTYVNTDADLGALTEALRRRPQASLCLHGLPGSGKTAFAVWLAEELGKPLICKRASELMDKYVGGTEQRLAAMFREATLDGAVLLLDEADTFLRDRRRAQRPWEVSQVNELLVQMEAFAGIFLCATNLIEDLDPAAFRRFSFKIRFDALKALQVAELLRVALGQAAPSDAELEAAARTLDGVTLGDFAAVARRYAVLDHLPTLAELAEALQGELAFRAPARKSAGFRA